MPLTIAQLNQALSANHPLWEDRLVRYFTHNQTGRSGSIFETIGGRGDNPAIQDQMTYIDCFSVTCLSVEVPPHAAHKMVDGSSRAAISQALTALPVGVILNATSWGHFGPAVVALYDFLLSDEHYKVGWVTAAKLLARKRPDLVPILENVVWHALGLTSQPASTGWHFIASAVTNTAIAGELQTIQSRAVARITAGQFPNALNARSIASFPLHRVLDILIWEEHKGHFVAFNASSDQRAANAKRQREDGCPF